MPRRRMDGEVVSAGADKTVTVMVERRFKHPLYKKYIKRTKKYLAHDEKNESEVGDLVTIEEIKPLSKRKTWAVKETKRKVEKVK